MKKTLISSLLVILFAVIALAHDPRTVAKDFSHTLTVEGAGKLTLSYKSLHYNDTNFNARKGPALTQFNRLWKAIGKFDTDFAVAIGGVQVPKGSYTMGINFDANDNFKLVLGSGGKDLMIPMQFAMDGPSANYLTFDFRPENDSDTFAIEARYGKARVSAEAKVPFLSPHDHPSDGAAKPPEKKP
jgi:opacity protein-like surface antigen